MVLDYDAAKGELASVGTATTLPKGFGDANTNAEVVVHPSGKFLYTSNRGSDTIAIFALDQTSGMPTPLGHVPTGGKTPRHFAIDPAGAVLFAENQSSGTITMFRIDAATGELTRIGEPTNVPSPVCLVFVK